MPKQTYALSESDVAREMKAVQEAWAILFPLDTNARHRVLEWLQSWASTERPDRSDDTF